MGTPALFELYDRWPGGVNTNTRADQLDVTQSPRGRNAELISIGRGVAIPVKRRGITMINTTSQGAIITGQFEYRKYSSGFTTQYLFTTSAGKLKVLTTSDGTIADADSGTATPFTTGEHYPDFAQANNLAFIVNGQENKKYNGTDIHAFGIATPSAAPGAVDNGAAGNPSGLYEFAITYYNSNTGQESSRSPIGQVTVINKKIDVSWSAPADEQVTHVRVYIRKTTLSNDFFRLTTGSSPAADSTHGGFAVAVTATTVDITDAQINALTSVAPSTSENNPPPVLDRIEFHQGRLFGVAVSDPSTLLFSKLSNDSTGGGVESWNPVYSIPINVKDGDRITAIHSSDELLYIFKGKYIYVLVGEFPTWQLRLITNAIGCTSHRSVFSYAGDTYFYSPLGPARINAANQPTMLAQPDLANTVAQENLAFNELDNICVGFDEENVRLVWSVPATGKTRNTLLLPYSIRLGCFESDRWEIIDVASFGMVRDSDGHFHLYFGDYGGRIFRWGRDSAAASMPYRDGIPSGTPQQIYSGAVRASTATTLGIVDADGEFYTGGSGLAQLYVYVRDADGRNVQRKRIGSNTGITLTLDSGETWDVTPTTTHTFTLSSADFEWDTRVTDFGRPFNNKRYEHLFLDVLPPDDGETEATIDMFLDFQTELDFIRSLSITTPAEGAVWDSAVWDVSTFSGAPNIFSVRKRIGRVGKNILVRVRHYEPNIPFGFTKIGITAEPLGLKR